MHTQAALSYFAYTPTRFTFCFTVNAMSVSALLSTLVNENPSVLFMLQFNTKTLFKLQDGVGGRRNGTGKAVLQELHFYSVCIIPFLLHIQSSIIQWMNKSSVGDCSFRDMASSCPRGERNLNNRQSRFPECLVTLHNKLTSIK